MVEPTAAALPAGWEPLDASARALAFGDGGVSGPAARRRALALFGGAAAAVLAGLVAAVATWRYAGAAAFLLALVLVVRAAGAYRASVGAGASSVRRDGPLLGVAAVVAAGCLVGGGFAVGQLVDESKDARASTGVGSCWSAVAASSYRPVDCSHAHRYVGTAVVPRAEDCADDATAVVVTLGAARLLCLEPA